MQKNSSIKLLHRPVLVAKDTSWNKLKLPYWLFWKNVLSLNCRFMHSCKRN